MKKFWNKWYSISIGRVQISVCLPLIASSFVELTKYRKLYKNNQQAGGLITRLPAIFFMLASAIPQGVQMPPLWTPLQWFATE